MSSDPGIRFAVYFTQRSGEELRGRAEEWLGRSVEPGTAVARVPTIAGLSRAEIAAVTVAARSYGFHATLKAPFRLTPGCTENDLLDALGRFCAEEPPVMIPAPRIETMDGFFALVPSGPYPAVRALVDRIVERFDAFRARSSPAEVARRKPEQLSRRQLGYLQRWGYPYVFGDYQFHLTLTDHIPVGRRPVISRALAAHFGPVLGGDLLLDEISLCVQQAPSEPFALHSSFVLSRRPFGAPSRSPRSTCPHDLHERRTEAV